MATHHLHTPLDKKQLALLRSGDIIMLSGVVYSARDAAHKRFMEALDQGTPLPFSLEGAAIYYMGPAPAPEGFPIGSAGPTTSYRMDAYTPRLYALGLAVTVGKGKRSEPVAAAIKKYGGTYLAATGGAGALASRCITSAEVIAYPELGAEAVRKLTFENFPLLVINDSLGNELYAPPKNIFL